MKRPNELDLDAVEKLHARLDRLEAKPVEIIRMAQPLPRTEYELSIEDKLNARLGLLVGLGIGLFVIIFIAIAVHFSRLDKDKVGGKLVIPTSIGKE